MRWLVAHLYADEPTGRTDALGVPVVERRDMGEAMVRAVPLASALRAPDGENPYDRSERAFQTPIPLKRARTATEAVVDGETYKLTGVADTGRMRLLTARKVK